MGIIHFFSEDVILKKGGHKLISLSAGVSLTYIFLRLFPEFSLGAAENGKFLFLSVLFGFVLLHLIETHIYQHTPRYKRSRELYLEDSIISFIYHFIIGIMVVNFYNKSFYQGLMFFIPVALYTSVSTLPVNMTKSTYIKIIIALSTLLGIIFSTFLLQDINQLLYLTLLGFIIGTLSFTVTRHLIPKDQKGNPFYFILGVIIYSVMLLYL